MILYQIQNIIAFLSNFNKFKIKGMNDQTNLIYILISKHIDFAHSK